MRRSLQFAGARSGICMAGIVATLVAATLVAASSAFAQTPVPGQAEAQTPTPAPQTTVPKTTVPQTTAPQTPTPKIEILEKDKQVTVRGQIGNDGSFRRTFQIQLDGVDTAPVRFLPSDLETAKGQLIDRRQVAVTGDAQLTRGPQNFLLTVTGVAEAGEYFGTIRITAGQNGPRHEVEMPVKLEARPNVTVSLMPETPSFALKLVTSPDRLTCFVLGAAVCPPSHTHSVVLRTQGGDLPTLEKLTLVTAGPDGSSLGASTTGPLLVDGRIDLSIDPTRLQAGQYSGRIIASFQNVATPLEVPVNLQVRIGVWWPLLAIVLGILFGQLARIMRERGDRQATMRLQYNRLLTRVRALTTSDAVVSLQDAADRAIDQLTPDAAAAELAKFESACQILEALDRYRGHVNFAQANQGHDARITNAIKIGDVDAAKAALDQLKAALLATPAAAAHGLAPSSQKAATPVSGIQQVAISLGNGFIQYWARPLLKVLLLVTLAWVGLSTLYADGSATFGSRPLVDLLALFAWGLSADVASRSLANVRGP